MDIALTVAEDAVVAVTIVLALALAAEVTVAVNLFDHVAEGGGRDR